MDWREYRTIRKIMYSDESAQKRGEIANALLADVKRVWAMASLLLANENFVLVLELLERADAEHRAYYEEIKKALMQISTLILNL